ncbi:triose-phosphate isomerase [Paracoccaceae bacterium GXU_MW_L88]
MKTLVAGNWKMNGEASALPDFAKLTGDCEILVCPPFTLISALAAEKPAQVMVGAQDCHAAASGAHTGDVSAPMLKAAGATHVILGHSERRTDHGETDDTVLAKAEAALAEGLVAIICVGETEAERDAGRAGEVVGAQIAGSVPEGATPETLVIAYEPVWAIGTGRVPTNEQITEMHALIREKIGDGVRILYGGSVKPGNAAEIFALPNVNGGLIGGASLKTADFQGIIDAA